MAAGSGGLVMEGLTKRYGAKVVVDDVSISAPRGSVTGFVGPNGSGKSTTLRMIVGHTRPTKGKATFDGAPLPELAQPARSVGVLLDASASHPGRSVVETAQLAALLIGVGRGRVRECLEAVGIDGVRHKRVGTLSLGMRQRLGIAMAVLGSPDFLILDEPANGLDPEGIHWLRQFLRSFAESGGCALVSSHQLGELEAASDFIVVIDRGRSELMEIVPSDPVSFTVSCSDDDRLLPVLRAEGLDVIRIPGAGLVVTGDPARASAVAAKEGLPLRLLVPVRESLEARFLSSTHGEFAGLAGDRLARVVQRKAT